MVDVHWYNDRDDVLMADVTPTVTLSVEGGPAGYEWGVNAHRVRRGRGDWTDMASGESPGIESAKLAAVEAWRRWAREQAEAAGWEVQSAD